jgi:hypothetical protein
VLKLIGYIEITRLDVICSTFFFQASLHVMIRLARRAFTLGEIVLVAHGATTLFLETVNISIIKVRAQKIVLAVHYTGTDITSNGLAATPTSKRSVNHPHCSFSSLLCSLVLFSSDSCSHHFWLCHVTLQLGHVCVSGPLIKQNN